MPAHLVGDQCHFYFRPGDPPPWYAPDTPEQTEMISKGSGRKKQKVEVRGHMGQAKGKKQVLWEWGLWKEGMILTIDDTDERGRSQDLSMDHTLQVSSSLYHCVAVCVGLPAVGRRAPVLPQRRQLSNTWCRAAGTS
jgi:hypothetical protein